MKLSSGTLSLLTVGLVFAALAAGVGWRILSDPDEGSNRSEARERPDTEGVEVASADVFSGTRLVEGAEVVRDTLWVHVVASGDAAGYRESRVAARTSGVVEAVHVRENQRVEAGDLMVQLDTVEATMQLAQARANLVTAEADYRDRQLRFRADDDLLQGLPDLPTPEERDRLFRIESGLESAEVELQRAEMEMDLTRIRAPFTGRVADLEVVEGAFLGSGGEVLTLVQMNPAKVHVNILEADLQYMEEGRRATVGFTGLPGEDFVARVESVNPRVDPELQRSARVTLLLENPGDRIRPGMYARVRVEAQSHPDRILVPLEAVVERGADRRDVVFVAMNPNEDGEAVTDWRYVTVGNSNETHVEIVPHEETSMLEPGEIVIVRGHEDIAHQTTVRLVENVTVAERGGGS